MGVSLRAVERARRIIARGIPELEALCKRGELKLEPAEIISLMSYDEQREAIAKGAAYCRRLAGSIRRAEAERKAEMRPTRCCPHCGGEL